MKFFRDFYGDYLNDPVGHARFMASAKYMLPENDLLEVLGPAFILLHERAATRAGKERWADKNPENVLYLSQWQHLLGDEWLLLHVARNPLDTLASIKEIKFPLVIPAGLSERIQFYRTYLNAGLHFGKEYPHRYYLVLYEQLVQMPPETVGRMMEWLGENLEPGQLLFNAFPHQRGLEDPKIANTSEIHAASNGRWRSLLTHEEAQAIWLGTKDIWRLLDPDGHHDGVINEMLGSK